MSYAGISQFEQMVIATVKRAFSQLWVKNCKTNTTCQKHICNLF